MTDFIRIGPMMIDNPAMTKLCDKILSCVSLNVDNFLHKKVKLNSIANPPSYILQGLSSYQMPSY